MKLAFSFLLIFTMACSSSPRKPTAVAAPAVIPAPEDALTLDQALHQNPEFTMAYLKAHSTVSSYPNLNSLDPMIDIPQSLRLEKKHKESDKERAQLLSHLRRFKPWTLARKAKHAHELLSGFQCSREIEGQAMGLSLERDFPSNEAQELSEGLHLKVVECNTAAQQESLLRLTVFSIQKGECPKALGYLKQFPPSPERGVNDRLAYLHAFCAPTVDVVDVRNPWGGYGIRLGDLKWKESDKQIWFLSTQSGNEEWDRLLRSLVELTEQGEKRKLQYVASQLNYEKLRTLPYPFQASVLVLLHFADADLTVFQTLHRYLADHPQLTTKEVTGLLFPVRYWKEIVENSQGVDPVLIKSLIRQESAFNPGAKSRARAYGLMQLIYSTARIHGIRKPAQLLDPKDNIRVGSQFLSHLINEFGSVELALAAYNAGPEVVKEWQKRYPTSNMDLFVEMIPYTETREYVRLIHRNYKIYQSLLGDQLPEKPSLAQNQALLP